MPVSVEDRPEYTSYLLYLKCEKRKVKHNLEKTIDKRVKRAVKAKPRNYTLQLYKEYLSIPGQKEDLRLRDVLSFREDKENLVLVLNAKCSDTKKKSYLVTMRFKTANGYANILCGLNEALKTRVSSINSRKSTVSSILPRNKLANDEGSRGRVKVRLPRVVMPANGEPRANIKRPQELKFSSTSSGNPTGGHKKRREYKHASAVPLNREVSGKRQLIAQEDSDYFSSIISDDYNSSDSEESDVVYERLPRRETVHFSKKRSRNYYLDSKTGVVEREIIQDSLGNPIRIIRPSASRHRSHAY